MAPRPSIPFSSCTCTIQSAILSTNQPVFTRPVARALQTTSPLVPPATPIPAIDHTNAPASSPSSSAGPSKLPPLLPASTSLPTNPNSGIDLIKSQSTPATGRYITARLHSRTYLLHPRDILTLPTLKPLQPPGTTLDLTRILEVGSREYSIRSPAAEGRELRKTMPRGLDGTIEALPDWVVRCKLTILEHTKSPLEKIVKTKRRKGYRKTIQHKQGWTRLRVGDIHLGEGQGEASA